MLLQADVSKGELGGRSVVIPKFVKERITRRAVVKGGAGVYCMAFDGPTVSAEVGWHVEEVVCRASDGTGVSAGVVWNGDMGGTGNSLYSRSWCHKSSACWRTFTDVDSWSGLGCPFCRRRSSGNSRISSA